MKIHEMTLWNSPFQSIASGEKTIELRLYDEKRKQITVGDRIHFQNADNPAEEMMVEVVSLHLFDSFASLYAHLPLEKCGYTKEELPDASPSDMDAYYPKEKQAMFGVIGIEVKRIDTPFRQQ